ncbi:MAG: chitobiase/beta-hexosaminidase C-terminal domain-containing protein [Candidatus Krumholzibacteriota bacterium]|nr:chitobiase/beta-hexosaminidase C-terminal domain-containing protein [Candidatus Krumholzibacteriota bacterium]
MRKAAIIALAAVVLISFGCSDDDSSPTQADTDCVSTPTFDPAAGSYDSVISVKINCDNQEADIYYSIDGSDPDESSTMLAAEDSIRVDSTTTIRARAYSSGMDPSAIAEAEYIIDLPEVEAPFINVGSVVYQSSVFVSITCATPDADIYFTTDGSTPDTNSTHLFSLVRVDSSCVLKARAFKEGMDPSPVASKEIVIIPDLVAYYTFDGDAIDVSGHGHDGTVYGATPATDRFGYANSAYQFDGTDDYIELPDETYFDFEEYSISFWVRISTLPTLPDPLSPGDYCLINKGSNFGNYTLRLRKFGGASYCNMNVTHVTSGGNWTTTGSEYIHLDQYYHVVVTMSDEIRFYYDGVLGQTSFSMPDPLLNDDNVLIGKLRTTGDPLHFEGILDDIRFYDRALSGSEISALYNAESSQ